MKELLVVMIMAVLGISTLGQTQSGASPREKCVCTAHDAYEAEQQRPVHTHRSFHRYTRRRSTLEYSH
jgi:hypothetical protein